FMEALKVGVDPDAGMYTQLLLCSQEFKDLTKIEQISESMHQYLSSKFARAVFNREFWQALFLHRPLHLRPASDEKGSIPRQGDDAAKSTMLAIASQEQNRVEEQARAPRHKSHLKQLQKRLDARGFDSGL